MTTTRLDNVVATPPGERKKREETQPSVTQPQSPRPLTPAPPTTSLSTPNFSQLVYNV
ncbi:UNVERIFIED_CONTAM: hypothetical protein FKN15_000220 [Acipenser sinensis]